MTINVIFESEDGTLWLGGSEGAKEKKAVILSFRETPPANNKTETQTSRIQPGIGITRYDTSNLNSVGAIEAIAEDAARNL